MPRRITLVRPSDMFRAMEDSMSNFINMESDFTPSVNIKEVGDKYELTTKVPGFKKDEIEISFHDNNIILEGKTKEETENADGDYIMQEYKEGSFKRVVNLPGKIDSDKVEASLVDGVLKISLPKLPDASPKKININ